MAVGGALVVYGEMSIGALIAAIQLLNSVFNPINAASQILTQAKGAAPMIEKITKELETPLATGTCGHKLTGDVDCQNLSAWYEENKPILSSFAHRFERGKTYAIIGESGRGKTTILKCLLRLHDRYSGDIRIGEEDSRTLSAEDIYGYIGYVPQNAYLFNETMEHNITLYGDYSQQELDNVMEQVNLSHLTENGRGTPGDSGMELSGGEKQRVVLARALIRKPHVLLLDEPTTALDPDTRDSINDLIFSPEGYTRIVITHDRRSEYLERFDEVISLT